MPFEPLIVALGERRYRVERPWGEMTTPGKVTDVAVDGAGRVAVLLRTDPYTEAGPDPVVLLTPEGRVLRTFGGGIVADAHKIAADGAGRFWVVDRDAHEILAFDAMGAVVARLGGRHRPLEPFNHPSDIAFGPAGEIVVADGYAGGHVHVFGPDLAPRHRFGAVGTAPGAFLTVHGIHVTRAGEIVVADRENSRLQVFDMGGRLLRVLDAFHRPSDVQGDAEGRLYVSDAVPTLTCLGPDFATLGRCRPVLNGAHGLAVAPDGVVYLAEGTPSRISRMVPA
jgi:peptidylglycine monooxygenase